ncbi:MAG: TSUP family transporter [Chitinophagaceae bacterium]
MSNTQVPDSVTLTDALAKAGKNRLFPVFLKIEELNVLLVGGGKVAFEKLNAILQNAPDVTLQVVATQISAEIKELVARYPRISMAERPFHENDLDNQDVIMVAVNDKAVSSYVRQLAKEKKLLVNVADTPDQCDFYLGAIVQKGDLKIAISTNGKSPTIAKRMREQLNDLIPDEIDGVLENMHTIRQGMKGDFTEKVKQLDDLTKGFSVKGSADEDEPVSKPDQKKWQKVATYSLLAFAFMILGHLVFSYFIIPDFVGSVKNIYTQLDKNFHWMVLAGFLAQLVDGALGMGYGVTSAAILLSTGINPAAISGSIHTAEMFASGASGYSHYKFGNVNKKLFKVLVIPGVVGAIAGALLLVFLGEKYSNYIRPILAAYTLFLGFRILLNAFKKMNAPKKFKRYGMLAGLGGFLDSFGGGGWGPIVTTTLITKGRTPRFVIGTVSLTEFFVTLASAFSFFILLGISHVQTIIALIIGGFIAAPIAARLAGKLPRRTSFILLGVLVIIWSIKILSKLL